MSILAALAAQVAGHPALLGAWEALDEQRAALRLWEHRGCTSSTAGGQPGGMDGVLQQPTRPTGIGPS